MGYFAAYNVAGKLVKVYHNGKVLKVGRDDAAIKALNIKGYDETKVQPKVKLEDLKASMPTFKPREEKATSKITSRKSKVSTRK
jgi:hypothetical protein